MRSLLLAVLIAAAGCAPRPVLVLKDPAIAVQDGSERMFFAVTVGNGGRRIPALYLDAQFQDFDSVVDWLRAQGQKVKTIALETGEVAMAQFVMETGSPSFGRVYCGPDAADLRMQVKAFEEVMDGPALVAEKLFLIRCRVRGGALEMDFR